MDFPGGSDGKESAFSAGDPCSMPGPGRLPGEGNDNPLQYSFFFNRIIFIFLPGEFHGQRRLDMTEGLFLLLRIRKTILFT